ncbi:Ribonuclease H domain [Sesbania bispinosa]|nr:Ribonuclease H domain [Sesbania bispinosa]
MSYNRDSVSRLAKAIPTSVGTIGSSILMTPLLVLGLGFGGCEFLKISGFMVWLVCHDSLPTRSTLSHRGLTVDVACPRCDHPTETILHCLRDCTKAREIWHGLGMDARANFYNEVPAAEWIASGAQLHGILFLTGLWEVWRSRNSSVFESIVPPAWETREVGCPCLDQIALNTNGSVIDNKGDFGGLLRSHSGEWIWGFYGNMGHGDILGAELLALVRGLWLCWDLQYKIVKCMTDSTLAISLVKEDVSRFHKYAGVVREIHYLLSLDWDVVLLHTLREGNQCADFLAKHGVAEDSPFVWFIIHLISSSLSFKLMLWVLSF